MAIFLLSGAAIAGDAPPPCETSGLRDSYTACLGTTNAVTSALQTCIDDELVYQNQRLNEAYIALMAALDKTGQGTLRDSESKWMAFRDSNCQADPQEGQGQQLDAKSCVLGETTRQATRLEGRLFRASLSK